MSTPTIESSYPARNLDGFDEIPDGGDFEHGDEIRNAGRGLIRPLDFRDEAHEGMGGQSPVIELDEAGAWIEPMNPNGAPATEDFPGSDDEPEPARLAGA